MKKEITWVSKTTGKESKGYYEDADDFSLLPSEKIKSVCAFCLCDGKFLIVKNEGRWEPVAGHVEKDEDLQTALEREIKEESSMKVLKTFPIGYFYGEQDDFYQIRYFCLVEPLGPFTSDPDGGVTEIKLVTADEILKYIDWKDTALMMRDKCLKIVYNLGINLKA
jgi:8-oxo-dGTP pyrophosphatase MutT (NUDIX family)